MARRKPQTVILVNNFEASVLSGDDNTLIIDLDLVNKDAPATIRTALDSINSITDPVIRADVLEQLIAKPTPTRDAPLV